MNMLIQPEDIISVVKSFYAVNEGDEATQDVILAIGAEILDISINRMMGFISQ